MGRLSTVWRVIRWPLLAIELFVLLALLLAVVGLPIWELLEVLFIPVFLLLTAGLVNWQQKRREQEIARDRREQDSLNQYYDRMSELLLKHDLRNAGEDDDEENKARVIVRARTLSILRSVDGERKGQVIQFLIEAGLIGPGRRPDTEGGHKPVDTVISLKDADLRHLVLTDLRIVAVNLRQTDLTHSDFRSSTFFRSDFSGSDLRGAKLAAIFYRSNSMQLANLCGADLSQARGLVDVVLEEAKYDEDTQWPEDFDPKAAGAILVDDEANPVEEAIEDSG